MRVPRKLPPIWLLGLTNSTFGMFAGFAVVTLPEMMAARGMSGGRIAALVAWTLSPGFWVFLLAPVLDVRFSRRTYALVFSVLGAAALGVTVAVPMRVGVMGGVMFFGYIAVSMVQGAAGGWVGSLIAPEEDSRLGAWFTVATIGAGGVMMVIAGEVMHALPPVRAGWVLGLVLMLPSLLYRVIPAPGPDRRLARESFRHFFGEIARLVRRREVLVALVLFALPSASFTLTNVLGGIGRDFQASERIVSLLAGMGAAVAGVVGGLLLPVLARRFALRPLYLGIGVVGAIFTLGLPLLPHAPWTFAVAITGENVFQALAFAAANAITFEVIGPGNPLAATLFSLLVAMVNLPITYMGFADGWGYTWRGWTGSVMVDAGVSLAVCGVLWVWLVGVRQRLVT